MARAKWKRRVGLGILAAGLAAWGAASAGERTLTVNEPGHPAQRCRVVQSWTEPNGSRVHQVQSLNTGEMLTVVETRPASGAPVAGQPIATQIYHWGDSKNPPIGAPVPSRSSTAVAAKPTATPAAAPVAAVGHVVSPTSTVAPPSTKVHRSFRSLGSMPVTKPSTPAAAVPAIPPVLSPAAEETSVAPAALAPRPTLPTVPPRRESAASEPSAVVVTPTVALPAAKVEPTVEAPRGRGRFRRAEPSVTTTVVPSASQVETSQSARTVRPPQVHQIPVPKMGATSSPSVAPAAASERVVAVPTTTTTVVECEVCEEEQRPGLLNRWLSSRKVPTPAPIANRGPVLPSEPPAATPRPVVKAEKEEPTPTDWRASWGKVAPSAEPARPLPRPVPPPAAPRAAARPTTPTAKATRSDPLESPALYSRVNVPGARESEPVRTQTTALPPKPVTAPSAPLPVGPAVPSRPVVVVPTVPPVGEKPVPAVPAPTVPPAPLAPVATPAPVTPSVPVAKLPTAPINPVPPVTQAASPAAVPTKPVETVKQASLAPTAPAAPAVPPVAPVAATVAPVAPPAPPTTPVESSTVLSPKSSRPSLFSLLTSSRPAGTPAEPTAPNRPRPSNVPPGIPPSVPPGMRSRIAAEIAAAEVAQAQAQGVQTVSISAFEGNAFSPGMQPTAQPGMVQPAGPAGGNAFAAGNFVPPQGLVQNQNAFLMPVPNQGMMRPVARQAVPTPAVIPPAQYLWVLRESLQPSQREQAVEALLAGPARSQPEVVQALRSSAQGDPAPSVRACCLRALARVQANDAATLAIVQAARADGDSQVRAVADQTLRTLTADAAVRPVSTTGSR